MAESYHIHPSIKFCEQQQEQNQQTLHKRLYAIAAQLVRNYGYLLQFALYDLISMKAKEEIQQRDYISPSSDKQAFKSMNAHIIKLLQDKLLPLKREKYSHLQKINVALRKDHPLVQSSLVTSLTLSNRASHTKSKGQYTARTQKCPITQDQLLHKLKKISHLSESTSRISRRTKIDQSLEQVQRKMADFQKQTHMQIERLQYYSKKWSKSRKRTAFQELTLKAERHLRRRKHEIKQKYQQEHLGKSYKKASQLQKTTVLLKRSPLRQTSQAQLQRQLLKDIRETMLQDKINRLKREINHKKIVQLW